MIVGADVHLGKINDSFDLPTGEKSQTHDVVVRLNELLEVAIKDEHIILLLGDIFTRVNPTTYIISVFFRWLSECKRNGVDVYILPGNHDSGFNWINTAMIENVHLDNVHVVSSVSTITIKKRKVFVIPHIPLETQAKIEEAEGMDKFLYNEWKLGGGASLIIGHGMLTSVDYNNDIFFEAGTAVMINSDVFDTAKLILLGHVHNFTEIKSKNKSVVYPGSLTNNNFGEVDDLKAYLYVDLENLHYSVHAYSSEVTPWVDLNIDLTEKDETDIDEKTIAELCKDAVIKVTIITNGDKQIDENYIRKLVNKYGKITRFETKALSISNKINVSNKQKSPEILLKEYIKNMDVDSDVIKKLAIKFGRVILSKVGVSDVK